MACQYTNHSDRIQIVKITLLDRWLERVLFPEQTLKFEAANDSQLEIYTYETITMTLADKIPCDQL